MVGILSFIVRRRRAGVHRPCALSWWRWWGLHWKCPIVRAALLLVYVLGALALSGCSTPPGSPADLEIRATVLRYDRLLAEGYRLMDMSRLAEVAEPLQAEDEYIHMSAIGEGGIRLLPVLTDHEFGQISIEGTSALVVTRETWDYVHEGHPGREAVLVQKGLTYEIAWDLARDDDERWHVTDVRAVSTTSTAEPQRLTEPEPGGGDR
ncbi:MAG: hypothetical protein ACYC6C_05995 [Coriobacteriia bacterium]